MGNGTDGDTVIPPFYIGQRVVCVEGYVGFLAKVVEGQIYTVLGLIKCTNCKEWNVGFEITEHLPFICCGVFQKIDIYFYASASRFAPIQEQFQAIEFTKVLEHELASVN